MKKILKLLLSVSLVLALTGCATQQTATYQKIIDWEDATATDTHTIDATGNKVIRVKEVVEVEFSDSLSAMEKSIYIMEMENTFKQIKDKNLEGVSIDYLRDGDIFKVTLDINTTSCDLKQLSDLELYTGNKTPEDGDKVSFKGSCKILEENGYTLVE